MTTTDTMPMRVMAIMPHPDDMEFNVGGTLALLHGRYGSRVKIKVVTTSTGASGHHEMSSDETFSRRQDEARKSAALIGAEYECLEQLDGTHVSGQVMVSRNLLGGLWNTIRRFRPSVLFCPPVAQEALSGVHVDHENTAQAIRLVAYQLAVPRAFPTTAPTADPDRYQTPVIINVDDVYTGESRFHVRQDISEVYERKCEMILCHQSQVCEWLPYTRGATDRVTEAQCREQIRLRHDLLNQRYGFEDQVASEYFQITRWGRQPKRGELDWLFPASSCTTDVNHDG